MKSGGIIMTLIKKELDTIRRDFMIKEVKADIKENSLGHNLRLNHSGNHEWPELLLNAVTEGDEMSLAETMRNRQCMRVYDAVSKDSGIQLQRVTDDQYIDFTRNEFNRIYLRGICREALDTGCNCIVLKDDSFEKQYNSSELLQHLKSNVELEDIIGIHKNEHRSFRVELK